MSERVIERRRLTVRDLHAFLRVLSRHPDVVAALARAAQSQRNDEVVAALVQLLGVASELEDLIADIFEMPVEEFRALSIDAYPAYLYALLAGEDVPGFFRQLIQFMEKRSFMSLWHSSVES